MLKIIFDKDSPPGSRRRKIGKRDKLAYLKRSFLKKEHGKDIVKSSVKIKQLLLIRFQELKLSFSDVLRDGMENGMKLNKSGLTRYFSQGEISGNSLTQFQILYLCVRFGISIQFKVEKVEYNQRECLRKVENLLKSM